MMQVKTRRQGGQGVGPDIATTGRRLKTKGLGGAAMKVRDEDRACFEATLGKLAKASQKADGEDLECLL